MFGRRRREQGSPGQAGEEIYRQLRSQALDAVGAGLAPPPPEHPDVSGVVVDVPAEGGHATVVALTDGTTSLYTSTGGGTIGAGAHAHVDEATDRLLRVAQLHLDAFSPEDGDA